MAGTRQSYTSYPLSPQSISELRRDLNEERANPRVWQALFNQTGTVIPSPTVSANTLPGTIIWSRAAAGSYSGSYNGSIFIAGKTYLWPQSGLIGTNINPTFAMSISNSQQIQVLFTNTAGSVTEFVLSNYPVCIEVFD